MRETITITREQFHRLVSITHVLVKKTTDFVKPVNCHDEATMLTALIREIQVSFETEPDEPPFPPLS